MPDKVDDPVTYKFPVESAILCLVRTPRMASSTFPGSRNFEDNVQLGALDEWWYDQLNQNLFPDVSTFSLSSEPTLLATQWGLYGCPNPIIDTPPQTASELVQEFQKSFRKPIHQIQEGLLTEAMRLLLDISASLVDNAGKMGIVSPEWIT